MDDFENCITITLLASYINELGHFSLVQCTGYNKHILGRIIMTKFQLFLQCKNKRASLKYLRALFAWSQNEFPQTCVALLDNSEAGKCVVHAWWITLSAANTISHLVHSLAKTTSSSRGTLAFNSEIGCAVFHARNVIAK